MKTFFTLIMPVLVTGSGFAGFMLFQEAAYITSAVCIVTSHLLGAFWIFKMTNRKVVMS